MVPMYRAAVFTISDSRSAGVNPDESGPAAESLLAAMNSDCVHRDIIPDERDRIAQALRDWSTQVDFIVTTGGTGAGPRDVTPEAVADVVDRHLPGFGEIMRVGTFQQTPLSIISRGGAGLIGRTLVLYLPGSPRAVRQCMETVAPAVRHLLKLLAGTVTDCRQDVPDGSSMKS